jgi:hypothetical protein
MTVWTHPIVGGAASPDSAPPLLAVAGSLAWLVACLAAAFAMRRAGRSWIAPALLAISAVSFVVFKSHAWPGGPIAFGGLAAAAAWIRRPSPR